MAEIDFRSCGFKTQEMYAFPNIINVQVYSGDCPCRCVHCPVGITEPAERKKRFGGKGIDLTLYKKILDEMSWHPKSTLRVHAAGEPLLWDNLAEALEVTHDNGIKSWIFTSAITNDIHLLETLCENTNIVEVSVNSTNPENYRATKGVNAFDTVRRNIEWMHHYISSNGLPTRLIASRVQSLDQVADEEFVRYWKSSGLVSDAFVRSYHTYNDLMEKLPGEKAAQHQPCLVHWARFNISVDGYAVVCFNELFKERLDPSLVLGDVNKERIADIWQSHKLVSLRKAELTADYSGLSFGDDLPCKNCSSCQPLFGNRETSEHQIRQLK